MTCVVCKRSNTKSPLLNFFQSKICGACKASFYRSLKKLHEHLVLSIVKSRPTHDPKVLTKVTNYKQVHLVNVVKIEALVWRYLSNPERAGQANTAFTTTYSNSLQLNPTPSNSPRLYHDSLRVEPISMIGKVNNNSEYRFVISVRNELNHPRGFS